MGCDMIRHYSEVMTTYAGDDQAHGAGDCAHAIEPERDRLRMLALDVR